MILTTRTKESIKTALAMSIAYGIALSMDWENPYWAGFAVAFISLATVGQSFNKGAMRMLGTFIAVVVALTLIGLFAQDRWPFMIFLSAYVGFCTYMMGGARVQYFWFVCGFVCVIICLDAGPDPVNAFNTAILRAQETGLGILAYSLVSVFLWPHHSGKDFDIIVSKLAATQQQLFQHSLDLMRGHADTAALKELKLNEIQEQTRFSQLLDAAESDTYEVRELRRQWRRYQQQSNELTETMERWRESFVDLQALDLQQLLPNLTVFTAELDERLVQINRVLASQAPDRQPVTMELELNETEVQRLSHFHRAALETMRARLQQMQRLTQSQFDSVCDIKGFADAIEIVDTVSPAHNIFVFDPDRMLSVVRIMIIMWLAWLILIYVDSIPGGSGFVITASVLGMIIVTTPQLSVTQLVIPIAGSVFFASVIYIFVMPQLSNFLSLGPLIFAVTFIICYLFATPQQGISRALGLAMFVMIASISNEQTYSFISVAITSLMFPLVFLVILITSYIPVSLRPDQAFLRLLRRYFRNGEYLFSSDVDSKKPSTFIDRWRRAYYARDLVTLPQKLGSWASHINIKVLPGTSAEQVQSIVTSLQVIDNRAQALHEMHNCPQAEILIRAVGEGIEAWRNALARVFQNLSEDPVAGKSDVYRNKLKEIMDRMEQCIEDTLNQVDEKQLTEQESENFYALLGAYRAVSEAVIDYAYSTEDIDWVRWQEARFA
jgi:uncharacterized membrane protein YccC